MHAVYGHVSGKNGSYLIVSCAAASGKPTAPTVQGVRTSMGACEAGEIIIRCTQVPYVDFIALTIDYRVSTLYAL